MGDMNRAIGADEFGVRGNKEQVSHGGELIREQLLKTKEFVLLNNLSLTVGGPFTWVQAGNESIRSCLDLALVSSNLVPFIEKMTIDKEKNFTPRRILKKGNKVTTVFTDHFSVEVRIKGLPRCTKEVEKVTSWNMLKPEGGKLQVPDERGR